MDVKVLFIISVLTFMLSATFEKNIKHKVTANKNLVKFISNIFRSKSAKEITRVHFVETDNRTTSGTVNEILKSIGGGISITLSNNNENVDVRGVSFIILVSHMTDTVSLLN